MTTFEQDNDRLLTEARERGSKVLGSLAVPQHFGNVTVYIGLIESALELAKLIQTEERDLTVIGAHHEQERMRIEVAFREIEMAMQTDFQRETELRSRTMDIIERLIASDQSEIALKFYERLLDGFRRGAFEQMIELRNEGARNSGSRLKVK
jgi:hypothetical protein